MVFWLACGLASAGGVVRYDFPPGMPVSPVYQVTVDGHAVPAVQTKRGAFLSFGMDAPVEVQVKLPTPPREVVVRPVSAGIAAAIDGSTVRFRLPEPRNLSVEVDGDLGNPLLVFANPVRPKPDPRDPKVRFFEGGKIHEAGEIVLGDGETLYLDGGAVVRGLVRARGAGKVAVRGPGVLDAGTRTRKVGMLVLRECREALLEDFLILDPFGWTIHLSGSENVRLHNTRVIGWRANSDGLDIEYSRNVTARGCFWRTNDDCIAVKAIYPPGVEGVPFEEMISPETVGGHKVARVEGDAMGGILVEDCVLWNDQAGQGFEIGFELRIDTIRGITFRDSDIIHVSGGAFSIHNGDRARIEDILIENVRVEAPDRLLDFHVGLSIYSDDCPEPYRRTNPKRQAPPKERRPEQANNPYQWYVPAEEDLPRHEAARGLVRNVVIRNVTAGAVPRKTSILHGYSPNRGISNVLIEGLLIAGKRVVAVDGLDIYVRHVEGLEFRAKSP